MICFLILKITYHQKKSKPNQKEKLWMKIRFFAFQIFNHFFCTCLAFKALLNLFFYLRIKTFQIIKKVIVGRQTDVIIDVRQFVFIEICLFRFKVIQRPNSLFLQILFKVYVVFGLK